MLRTKKIYNKSTCEMIEAVLQTCPSCKGGGWKDVRQGTLCDYCEGHGEVWKGSGGAILPKHGRVMIDEKIF